MKKYFILFIVAFALSSSCIACFGTMRNWTSGYKETTVDDVGDATFKISIEITVEETIVLNSSGTGFNIATGNGISIIMTAGHVCIGDDILEGSTLRITNRVFKITSNKDTSYDAYIVVDNDELDVCLMAVLGEVSKPLHIAKKHPKIGDKVKYVGAPSGFWVEDFVQVFGGLYGGNTDFIVHKCTLEEMEKIWPDTCDDRKVIMAFYSVWAEGGSSGSPVFTEDGVVGILTKNTHAHDGGGEYTAGVDMESLAPFFEMAKELTAENK